MGLIVSQMTADLFPRILGVRKHKLGLVAGLEEGLSLYARMGRVSGKSKAVEREPGGFGSWW